MTEETSTPPSDETQIDDLEPESPKIEYTDPVAKLLTLGEPRVGLEHWGIYFDLGIRREHIPALIQMVGDDALYEAESDSPSVWAPVHAWRALGNLKAKEAVEPLLRELWRGEDGDDWMQAEFGFVMMMIGAPAIPALNIYLNPEPLHGTLPRIAVIWSLINIATQDDRLRIAVGEIFRQQLEKYERHYPIVNAYLAFGLVLTTDPEDSAELVSQAALAKRIDVETFDNLMSRMAEIIGEDDDLGEDEEWEPGGFPFLSPAASPTPSSSRKANKTVKAKRKQAAKSRKQNRKKRK
ncbi:MAG: hypothetical protein SF029_16280 [bacterium]|nr:hypothetical protein [bacterium]